MLQNKPVLDSEYLRESKTSEKTLMLLAVQSARPQGLRQGPTLGERQKGSLLKCATETR